jgi:L-ascorbate metabolism protein UlaG (beta-lactamase superfamily)/predicted small lipoprotein YifL
MKKAMLIMMVFAIILMMAACGGNGETQGSNQPTSQTETERPELPVPASNDETELSAESQAETLLISEGETQGGNQPASRTETETEAERSELPVPATGDEAEASVGSRSESSSGSESENTSGEQTENQPIASDSSATLLYQGHASLRITTVEGNVVYIDPYAGEGYDVPADLILVTDTRHFDHSQISRVEKQNPGCATITQAEALANGKHRTFELGFVTIEAVEAGYNELHDITNCVGYILTFSDGKTVYVSGDTSKTEQMPGLAERNLDYAFFCADGVYNMGVAEASECAALVKAKNSVPYHLIPNELFSRELAEEFEAEGRLIIADGEEITL